MSEPMPEMSEELVAALAGRGQSQGWRPGCVNCANNHKLAIAELVQKLGNEGLQATDPEFGQRVQQALQVGQLFAANPMAFQGLNGDRPEMIPPVRPAELLVSGNSLCLICLTPQKQTSLAIAPAGWHPGMGT